MQQLRFKIQTLNINDKDNGSFSVKFIDPKTPKQQIKLDPNDNAEWTVDIDESIIKMITNSTTLQIFDVVSNKNGSINETLLGITHIDLTHFLYGETEMNFTNIIQSIEDKNDIGTMAWISTLTHPIFSDKEIDCNNYLSVEINKMENIPKTWVDYLNKSRAHIIDKKKAKGKQPKDSKHWLQCECKLFEKDIPSFNININVSYNELPKIMQSEKQNHENDEKNENNERLYLNWNFNSKYLLTRCSMTDIKPLTDVVIKITHNYEEINENEQVVIVQDPNYLSANFDIKSLFHNSEYMQSVQLSWNDNNQTEQFTTIEIRLCLNKSLKEYFHQLNSTIHFKDVLLSKQQLPNDDEKDKENNNDLNTQKCVNDIIRILVDEHIDFMQKTSIQQYDNQRMTQAFVYHLNTTGLYNQLKEKLVKPEISKYVDKMASAQKIIPLNTMYANVLGSMISNLSNNVWNDINPFTLISLIKEDTKDKKICVKKHIEIANDFQTQKMIANAYNHYKTAFELSKSLNIDIHWNSLQNLVKILIQQSKINEAISILTSFVINQTNHNESLMFLSAILIENKHENAKCVIYQLCDHQFNSTSLMLKSAFFAINNNETRSNINFKRAIKLSNQNMNSNQLQQQFDTLFELKCVEIISIILHMFEKFEQIDINFHTNHAKLDLETKRYGTAMASINEAIQINDELPQLYAIKGHIEYESDKKKQAKQSYIKHLQWLPGTAQSLLPAKLDSNVAQIIDKLALYNLGKMYQNTKEYKLSLQTFFDAIIFYPDSYLFWSEAGHSLFHLNNYLQSLECFQQSNLINSTDNNSCFIMIAICYLALGQPKKAIKIMKDAIKFGINNINDRDKKQIQQFGQNLCDIGYVQSGKFFNNFVV